MPAFPNDRRSSSLDRIGVVGAVSDQHESLRRRVVQEAMTPLAERSKRHRQLVEDVLDILSRRLIVRHPDQVTGCDHHLLDDVLEPPGLGNQVADLAAEFA